MFSFLSDSLAHRMTEEQITLQIGSYSNYVGSHFWNFQDEIYKRCSNENEEIECGNEEYGKEMEEKSFYQVSQLFRSGTINGRKVSTPRAVIIDHRYDLNIFPIAQNYLFTSIKH